MTLTDASSPPLDSGKFHLFFLFLNPPLNQIQMTVLFFD